MTSALMSRLPPSVAGEIQKAGQADRGGRGQTRPHAENASIPLSFIIQLSVHRHGVGGADRDDSMLRHYALSEDRLLIKRQPSPRLRPDNAE